MSAPTKELEIGGHKIIVKEYLTARDAREIELKSFADSGKLTPEQVLSIQDDVIQLLVVSLDDSAENILDRLLDLPKTVYNTVRDLAMEALTGKGDDKKKE